MAISVRRLLTNSEKYDIKLISGENGMNNQVRWVHIIENEQTLSFLKGYELVFTTGIGMTGATDDDYVSFASSLIDRRVSGWVINVGPYIEDVPQKLISFCEEKNFPLFTIPWKEKLVDVTYELSHSIILSEDKSLTISDCISGIIFHSGDEASYAEVLEREGFRKDDKYQIVYFNPSFDHENTPNIHQIEPKIYTLSKYALLFENTNLAVVMADASKDDIEDIIDQIKDALGRDMDYYIGVSSQARGLFELARLFKQAKLSADCALNNCKPILSYSEIGAYQIIGQVDDEKVISEYLETYIENIVEYDKNNGTNYLDIIKLYIKCDGSVKEMADILNVHRNTINYKIKFIKSFFNLNMTIEELARVYLAIIIIEMKRR